MKNFNLLLIFFALILCVSCEKSHLVEEQIETSEPAKISHNPIPAKDYGTYHNAVLKVYMDSKRKKGDLAFKNNHNFNALLLDMAKVIKEEAPELYNEEEINNSLDKVNLVFENKEGSLKRSNYFSFMESTFNKLTTPRIENLLLDILHNDYEYEEILGKLEGLSSSAELTASELETMQKLTSVLKGSHDYWMTKSPKGTQRIDDDEQQKATTQVLVADCFGALFTGFGAAGMSLAIHILQDGHPL